MKAKVVKEYIDRYTQEFHTVGEMVSLTGERFAEIIKAGRYVEEVKQGETSVEKIGTPEGGSNQNPANQGPIEEAADQGPIEPPKSNKISKKPHGSRK